MYVPVSLNEQWIKEYSYVVITVVIELLFRLMLFENFLEIDI